MVQTVQSGLLGPVGDKEILFIYADQQNSRIVSDRLERKRQKAEGKGFYLICAVSMDPTQALMT